MNIELFEQPKMQVANKEKVGMFNLFGNTGEQFEVQLYTIVEQAITEC